MLIMKNEVKIQVRAYNVTLRDIRTNETVKDAVILTKEQLKAYDDTGLTLEGILLPLYKRKGYRVVNISAPVKRGITVKLAVDGKGAPLQSGVTYWMGEKQFDIKFRPIQYLCDGQEFIAAVPEG